MAQSASRVEAVAGKGLGECMLLIGEGGGVIVKDESRLQGTVTRVLPNLLPKSYGAFE